MVKRRYKFFIVLVVLAIGVLRTSRVGAEECDDPGKLTDSNVISSCISKYGGILEAISKANANNQQELKGLQNRLAALWAQIKSLDGQVTNLSKDIFERKVKIGVKEALLSAKVRQDYVSKREQSTLMMLFAADSAADFFRDLSYREKLARQDREVIKVISGEVTHLQQESERLSKQKDNLAALKGRVDNQANFLAKEIEKASKYVDDLGGKIAALSARQQALLAEKTGTYTTSVGDVPLADDPAARPDFDPGFRPAFAMFSFGAPHFKGLSQYGAFGRAKAGQNYETILRAYYGDVRLVDVNTNFSIRTSAGTMSFEDRYIKGIAEMPTQWANEGGMEALKAQAIAARSYALAYTGWRMGNQQSTGSICVTEACQVWKSSKADSPGAWGDAASQTRGKILVSNTSGEVVNAWYASTSGGYQESYSALGHTTPGFWDTTSDWTRWADGAWEVKGGSPWFYKGWYRSRSGKTCGRSSPWLKEDEFADVVNAAIVVANGGDTSGIFPEDVRSCWGGSDNPWSKERMASEAGKYGGVVNSVSGVRVEHGSNGITNRVILTTNRGEVSVSGPDFGRAFDLRAPGALSLKSGLFNIEKK